MCYERNNLIHFKNIKLIKKIILKYYFLILLHYNIISICETYKIFHNHIDSNIDIINYTFYNTSGFKIGIKEINFDNKH